MDQTRKIEVGVVGNPNCGKTTLFNALTGAKQQVGNWPGVTVERKVGHFSYQGTEFELVDLPGTYSLDVADAAVSLDEKIAREYVAEREADVIVNIVDASNLERNLYLTSQLLEMKVPTVVALNMLDMAEEHGIRIDADQLAKNLGCPVVAIVASKEEGVDELQAQILNIAQTQAIPEIKIEYAPVLEQAVEKIVAETGDVAKTHHFDPRWAALELLEGDILISKRIGKHMDNPPAYDALRQQIEDELDNDLDIIIADARYTWVNQITKDAVNRAGRVKRTLTDKIDNVMINRFLGIPIFLGVMYLMFMFTINIGGAFIDFFDILFGTVLVDGLGNWMSSIGAPEWLIVAMANGIGGGIQTVATFIPIVGFLFLFLSVLEDSGYMARAAFVIDRFMRFIGLPGKSFVPLIVGFGCNVPAIMATRTLENSRDRILTIMMNPFMSCGARLPVYALFAAAFFPIGGQNVVFGLYLIGILAAVLTGLVMKNTLLQGQSSPYVMEMPPYHLPTAKGILIRTWERLKNFIWNAGKVIVPMVLVLNFLNSVGTDGQFGHENSDQSVLSEIGRTLTPAFAPMGMEEENWPAAVGVFTGVLAKEAVVGTLDALYTELAKSDAAEQGVVEEEEEFSFSDGIAEAFQSIPDNLAGVSDMVLDPLGIQIGDVSNLETAAEEQEVSTGTFGAMQARFDGQVGAFAYLLFILLYFPCAAATAAVYREAGMKWTIMVAAWTTGIAYIASTVYYQLGTFAQHPGSSIAWSAGMIGLFLAVVLAMRLWSRQQTELAG